MLYSGETKTLQNLLLKDKKKISQVSYIDKNIFTQLRSR